MSLDGKVAVVSGATKGVGRGIARELALHGAHVFVTGRSAPDHLRLDERITCIRCDHRIETQVEAAFSLIVREANPIDILVNNVWGVRADGREWQFQLAQAILGTATLALGRDVQRGVRAHY
jgi:NAD(P)-dependent dehydrogenase (short-subunit alcohol dehydrogenase family)